MADQTFGASVLPTGRVVKFFKLDLETLEAVQARAGAKAGRTIGEKNDVATAQAFSKEKVLTCLRAITLQPVPAIIKKVPALGLDGKPVVVDGKPVEVDDFDDDAIIKSVDKGAGGGWAVLTYESLITDGPTSFKALFNEEISDYVAVRDAIDILSFPRSARAGSVPKVRLVSGAP